MVTFDPKKFYEEALKKEKYDAERQNLFFNSILLEKKKLTRELNLSLNVQNINIYFPFHYSTKDDMLLFQIKDLRLYKREDQKDSDNLNEKPQDNFRVSSIISSPAYRHSYFSPNAALKKHILEFNPIFLRLNCLKVLIVSDYFWEEKENLFLQNLQKLRTAKKNENLYNKIEENTEKLSIPEEGSKIIIETLPISFRLEKYKTLETIKNDEFMEQRKVKRLHTNDKNITPQTSKLSIELPMIIINLTIGQLFTLMALSKIWGESGPDLYKAVMDETKLSSRDLINGPKINKNANNATINHPSSIAQRNYSVDPNINYANSAVEEILETFEIFSMNLNCEGIDFSLYLKNHHKKEIFIDTQKHTNRIFSVFIDRILLFASQKYFQTQRNINIRKIIFQNHNCLDIDFKYLLKRNIQKKLRRKERVNNSLEKKEKNTHLKSKFIHPEDHKEKIEVKGLNDSILEKLSKELSEIIKIKPFNGEDKLEEFLSISNNNSNINNRTDHQLLNLNDNSENYNLNIKNIDNSNNKSPPISHCKHCFNSSYPHRRRLIINSLSSSNETSSSLMGSDHIHICIKTNEKELEKCKKRKVTYQDIEIKLTDFIIVIDPIVIQALRRIFDFGSDYSIQLLDYFKEFMKNNGFWPDFMFREQNPHKNHTIPTSKPKPEEANSRISLVMNSLTLLFHYQRSNIYILNMKTIIFISEDFLVLTNMRLSAENLSLHDTSANAGKHTNLILNYDKDKISKLDCEIKLLDENLANIMKHSTYVGVRIVNAKVLFLKRIIVELIDYIRKHVLPSFSSVSDNISSSADNIKEIPIKVPSSFKLEILVMDSLMTLYQNSISQNLLYVGFHKVCIWSTGLWGFDMGELLKFNVMGFEKNKKDLNENEKDEELYSYRKQTEESPSNINQFEKPRVVKEKKLEPVVEEGNFFYETRDFKGKDITETLNEFFETNKAGAFMKDYEKNGVEDIEEISSKESEEDISIEENYLNNNINNNNDIQTIKEIYRIKVEGLKILTEQNSSEEDALFAKTPKDSMSIKINLEDEDFFKERIEEDDNKEKVLPITIQIKFNKLWIYSYEPEFSLLMNILQENLGEIPQTVINTEKIDIKNNRIFLFVKVSIEEALLKIFKGSRDDIKDQGLRKGSANSKGKTLYKNSNSLALINLKDISFKMLMQENGGKKMILAINKVNMSDLRMSSRLTHYNKSFLFSYVPNQFNFDENTVTTTQEPLSPLKDYFNENNMNQEELNQNIEEMCEEEHGLTIEFDFDDEKCNKNEQNKESTDILHINRINSKKNSNFEKNLDSKESYKGKMQRNSSKLIKNFNINKTVENNVEKTWKEKIKEFFTVTINCCRKRKKKNYIVELPKILPLNDISPCLNNKSNQDKKNFLNFGDSPHSKTIQDRLIKVNFEEDLIQKDLESKPTDYIIHNLKFVKQPYLEDLEEDDRKNFQGKDSELKLVFTSRYDGEKLIKIKLNNKNLIVLIDLITDLVSFFMKPFDGTNVPSYIRKIPPFNNNPPMIVKVELSNIYMILLADYNNIKDSESISILIDLNYEHKWLGDAYLGPGSIDISVYLFLKRFCLFKTSDLINDAFIKGESDNNKANFPFFNLLVEQFEIKFLSNYRISFYTMDLTLEKRRKYNLEKDATDRELLYSFSEKTLQIKNLNGRKEIHLPIKKIKGITKVITLLTEPSVRPDQNPVYSFNGNSNVNNPNIPPLKETDLLCIEKFDLLIEQINIHILKNKNKIQYGKVIFKDFRLVGVRKKDNYLIKLRGTISIDYFNKRKMDFEPLLEPWTLILTVTQIRENFQFILQNDESYVQEAYFIKENKNSLNFNITTAGIETLLEAYRIFSYESLDENEPCKLYNKTGCMIRYKNSKLQEKQKNHWLHEHCTCDIWSKFKPKKPSRSSKSLITHTAINILLVNKDISNIISEAQYQPVPIPEERTYEEETYNKLSLFNFSPKIILPPINNNSNNNGNNNMNNNSRNIEKKPMKISQNQPIIKYPANKASNTPPEFSKKVSLKEFILPDPYNINLTNNSNNQDQDKSDKRLNDFKELEIIYERSEQVNKSSNFFELEKGHKEASNPFLKPKKKVYQHIEGLESEKDHKLSDYRMIKDVSLDHVGKTVYKLERINRIDPNKQNSNKNIFGIDINFDPLDFLSKTRKINEEGNNYMVVDVRFSPQKGYKEIFVTTSVKFLNKLNTDIDIGFYWKYKKNPLETITIKPDHEYYVPLKFIEASTLVAFKNNRMGGLDYIHWEDDKPDSFEDSNIEEKTEDETIANIQNFQPLYDRFASESSPDNRRNASPLKSFMSPNVIPTITFNNNLQTLKPSSSVDHFTYSNFASSNSSIKKGISKINLKDNENRDKTQNNNDYNNNNNPNPISSRVPVSVEYEKYDLDKFICDKVTVGDFESVDEHELYKKEHSKKGLLVYKNDFVVNSIHHHGKASYGNFYFILSCVKAKMETQKRHNKEREEICYETTLILLPIFKITNLTMSPLVIEYGGFAQTYKKKNRKLPDDDTQDHKYSKKTLFPKSSYGCSDIYYGEDLSFNVTLISSKNEAPITEKLSLKSKDIRIYKSEKNFQIPIKLKGIKSNEIKDKENEVKDISHYNGKNFYLWAEFKKTSPKSREIIIYCPYLIIDETNKLYFKESSSLLSAKTYAKYFKSVTSNQLSNDGINISKLENPRISPKQENLDEILEKSNINDQAIKDRVKKEMDIFKKIYMFSTSKKMKAIQIALKDSLKIWSKPCPLQTTEEVLSVIEAPVDREAANNPEDRNNNFGYYENKRNNFNFLSKTINRQHSVKQVRKKYQFGVKIIPAPYPFERSKLIVFTPR